jgi:hypothetical protein
MKKLLLITVTLLFAVAFTSCKKAKKEVKEAAATSVQVVKDDLRQTAKDTKAVVKEGYDSVENTTVKIKNDVEKN